MSSVSHPNNQLVASYTYDNVGNRASLTRVNGVTTTYTYDVCNRLTDLVNSVGPSFHYTLRADGKRTGVTETGSNYAGYTNYIYDADGRLTSEVSTLSSGVKLVNNQYSYDAVGNRISKTINGVTTITHFDANDRITDSGYSFDANGNQTTVNGQVAAYDFENHLVQLGPIASPTAIYSYDADGNRLSVSTASGTTNFLVDTEMPFATVSEERDGSGNLIARYDYGDDLISMARGASTSYYIFDGHGSTRALTNTSASITDTWVYDAWGGVIAHAGTTPNEFLYNGQQFDNPTGTYYLRARYYNQADGRFISTDPFCGANSDPITLHKYLYAYDDPINYIDPTGKFGIAEVCVSVGIVTTLATAVYGATHNWSPAEIICYSIAAGILGTSAVALCAACPAVIPWITGFGLLSVGMALNQDMDHFTKTGDPKPMYGTAVSFGISSLGAGAITRLQGFGEQSVTGELNNGISSGIANIKMEGLDSYIFDGTQEQLEAMHADLARWKAKFVESGGEFGGDPKYPEVRAKMKERYPDDPWVTHGKPLGGYYDWQRNIMYLAEDASLATEAEEYNHFMYSLHNNMIGQPLSNHYNAITQMDYNAYRYNELHGWYHEENVLNNPKWNAVGHEDYMEF